MESSIWVAVITVLKLLLHFWIIIFCRYGTSSAGISTPKSPRATIIPSAARMISSIFCIPSAFSILAMIGINGASSSFKKALISSTHSAFLTKDAAIKSTSCSTPNLISSLSLSVIAGSLTGTFGTFTPLRSPSSPPLITVQMISRSVLLTTSSPIRPSSISIIFPLSTSSTSPL